MAKRARRKQKGVLSTLFVELSALMGILGIAQPAVRNNLWSIVNPPHATSTQNLQGQGTAGSPAASSQQGAAGMQVITQTRTMQQTPQPSFAQSAAGSNPATANVMQPNSGAASYNSAPSQIFFAPTYTAQTTLPLGATNRPRWQGSTYSPMGGYQ